jgi:hypothetical protein
MAVARLLQALSFDNWQAVQAAIADIESAGLWRSALLEIQRLAKPPHAVIRSAFLTEWLTRGHRIREQVADDELLLDTLHLLLPAYDGSDLILYRGESTARWERRACGSAWTTDKEVACMFGSGLNAMHPGGGVLLSTDAPARAIIAGPDQHSLYLGEHEYVVDRRMLGKITMLERFPQI